MIKINNFRGDLTDVSAKIESLELTRTCFVASLLAGATLEAFEFECINLFFFVRLSLFPLVVLLCLLPLKVCSTWILYL